MTPKQAAIEIGCTVSHVRRMINLGKLPAKKVATENNQHGYVYDVSSKQVSKIKSSNHSRGWPRGKTRKRAK